MGGNEVWDMNTTRWDTDSRCSSHILPESWNVIDKEIDTMKGVGSWKT